MNQRRRYRAVIVLGAACLLIVGACGLWLRPERPQEALNRQLIEALVKEDAKQALALVNAGADPNTPFDPPSPHSLTQLWNRMFHRPSLLPRDQNRSAFDIACGAYVPTDNGRLSAWSTDDPHLVEAMLQHGAQKNGKGGVGWTPLFCSVSARHPKTVDILLNHGVDVNALDQDGFSILLWVVLTSPMVDPSGRSTDAIIVRQLLAHGAASNLPDMNGRTPLRIAHANKRPDLVALLKQAGAKKRQ
jgi:ankyrin repeat protein